VVQHFRCHGRRMSARGGSISACSASAHRRRYVSYDKNMTSYAQGNGRFDGIRR
jgi:hypothetical protein